MNQLDLLVTKADFAPYVQISKTVDEEKFLQPNILHAQNLDVKPVFGNAAFTDLINNKNEDKYQSLLNGGTYVDAGLTLTFQGLKASIVLFAFSRYILTKNIVDTSFGLVSKDTDVSTPVDMKSKQAVAQQARAAGQAYLDECLHFLCLFPQVYTLFNDYRTGKTIANNKPNFFAASRY
jgi:hypothetical protein